MLTRFVINPFILNTNPQKIVSYSQIMTYITTPMYLQYSFNMLHLQTWTPHACDLLHKEQSFHFSQFKEISSNSLRSIL